MTQEFITQKEGQVEAPLETPKVSTQVTLATKLQYAVTSVQSEIKLLEELRTQSEGGELSRLQKETFIARFSGLPQYSHENDSAIALVNSVLDEKNSKETFSEKIADLTQTFQGYKKDLEALDAKYSVVSKQ